MEDADPQSAARFDAMYVHYRPYVDAYARRRVTPSVVDDVVAETFATLWRRLDDTPNDALPWLYAVARNVVGTQYRTALRWSALVDKVGAMPSRSEDSAASVATRIDVERALATLSDDDRELLLLTTWEGLTPSDVAAALGIATGTVSVRLHRARQRLRLALEGTP